MLLLKTFFSLRRRRVHRVEQSLSRSQHHMHQHRRCIRMREDIRKFSSADEEGRFLKSSGRHATTGLVDLFRGIQVCQWLRNDQVYRRWWMQRTITLLRSRWTLRQRDRQLQVRNSISIKTIINSTSLRHNFLFILNRKSLIIFL